MKISPHPATLWPLLRHTLRHVLCKLAARRCRPGWAVALMAGWLAGCSLIPLSSLWALRQLDLMTLDPRQLQVLLYLPAAVGPQPETVLIQLQLSRDSASPGAAADMLEETLALRPRQATTEPLPSLGRARPGGHWVWLALGDAEVQHLEVLRARAQAWKAAEATGGKKRRLTLNLTPQLCNRSRLAPLVAGEVKLSAWVRWEAGQALIPILEQASGRDVDDKAGTDPLPPCGTLAG
jgi:hypothetical protein